MATALNIWPEVKKRILEHKKPKEICTEFGISYRTFTKWRQRNKLELQSDDFKSKATAIIQHTEITTALAEVSKNIEPIDVGNTYMRRLDKTIDRLDQYLDTTLQRIMDLQDMPTKSEADWSRLSHYEDRLLPALNTHGTLLSNVLKNYTQLQIHMASKDITLQPEVQTLIRRITEALKPFPEAQIKVLEAIQDIK